MWFIDPSLLSRAIEGFPPNYTYSFPSGHTMTGFAMAAVLSSIWNKRWLALLLLLWAMLIGYSRIYLCMHFFVDTVWGAIMGMLAAKLSQAIVSKWLAAETYAAMDGSLLKHFRTNRTQTKSNFG
jgi:membrane-associated phospholipid phosphatase